MRHRNIRGLWLRLYIASLSIILFIAAQPAVAGHGNSKDHRNKIDLLIVHSYDENLPDYPHFNELVEDGLKKQDIHVNTSVFYLDCDAYDHDGEIQRINDYLDSIRAKPDIILVVDDQATYSLLASGHQIAKSVPIIFSGVNFPNWKLLKEYPNVTGLWDNPDYEKNIRMIEDMVGIKRIRFFYDKTFNGKRVLERLAEQYKDKDKELYESLTGYIENGTPIRNEIEITNEYLRGNDYEEHPSATELYFINMRDELGSNLLWNIAGSFKYSVFLLTKYDYTIAKVGRLATVPTFSAVNKGFGHNQDILGGYFTTEEDQVEKACEYIAGIASGKDAGLLPIMDMQKKFVVDWNVLNRWGIPADDVPMYVEVVNIPFLVKYKAETIFFAWLFAIAIISVIAYLFFLYRREAKRKRHAQTDLWEEKEFLSLALEGGNIFAWKYDADKETFSLNKEFIDNTGMASDGVTLNDMVQKICPEDRAHAVSVFNNVIDGFESRSNLRARADLGGNGYLWYDFRFLNVSGVLGGRSSVIGLVMNIQDYKNKEDELIAARDMAAKAELKQSFLTNMSHEIRTPLNAIVGFSNLLVGSDDLSAEDKGEFIGIINKNCGLLLKLINDILEISRIESGNMSFEAETCSLNSLIEDVYEMCLLQAPNGVEFIKDLPLRDVRIETDVTRIKQVIVNFINNAFKFTSSGHILVGIDNDEKQKEVCIYVEDTGTGISMEQQKMIFDRFYKVDEFAQGTGLGLSICQVIAERLNGRLTLSSEEGKGSRFGIILPYANRPDADRLEEETAHDKSSSNTHDDKPVVLIAEDSVSNYMVLNNILKKYCNIVWAINGKDALEIVRKRKIDLVLMDIKMQQMDGITALTKIRKLYKNLPVIMQTAYAFDENLKMAKQAGASGFIIKPISKEILLTEISNFIRIDDKPSV